MQQSKQSYSPQVAAYSILTARTAVLGAPHAVTQSSADNREAVYKPPRLQKSSAHPLFEHAVPAHRVRALCAGHASLALPTSLQGSPMHGFRTGEQARVSEESAVRVCREAAASKGPRHGARYKGSKGACWLASCIDWEPGAGRQSL